MHKNKKAMTRKFRIMKAQEAITTQHTQILALCFGLSTTSFSPMVRLKIKVSIEVA